jgi:hypothetical protein
MISLFDGLLDSLVEPAIFLLILVIAALWWYVLMRPVGDDMTSAEWILAQPDLDDWETGLIDAALYGSTESGQRLAVLRAVRRGEETHGLEHDLAGWMRSVE